MAENQGPEPEVEEKSLLERLSEAKPGSDEEADLIDDLITQDMSYGYSRARKRMAEAARRKEEESREADDQKGE